MSKNATSIPTAAMLNAEAAEEETTAPAEESNDTITITIDKKKIKKALFGTAAVVAVTYIASRLLGSTDDEDSDETIED